MEEKKKNGGLVGIPSSSIIPDKPGGYGRTAAGPPIATIASSQVWDSILQYALLEVCQQQWPMGGPTIVGPAVPPYPPCSVNEFILSSPDKPGGYGGTAGPTIVGAPMSHWENWKQERHFILGKWIEQQKSSLSDPIVLSTLAIKYHCESKSSGSKHKTIQLVPNDAWVILPQLPIIHPSLLPIVQTWRTAQDTSSHKAFQQKFQVDEQELKKIDQIILVSNAQLLLTFFIQNELMPFSEKDLFSEFSTIKSDKLNSILQSLRQNKDIAHLRNAYLNIVKKF